MKLACSRVHSVHYLTAIVVGIHITDYSNVLAVTCMARRVFARGINILHLFQHMYFTVCKTTADHKLHCEKPK